MTLSNRSGKLTTFNSEILPIPMWQWSLVMAVAALLVLLDIVGFVTPVRNNIENIALDSRASIYETTLRWEHFFQQIDKLPKLAQENRELEARVVELEAEVAAAELSQQELKALQEQLGSSFSQKFNLTAASIVGKTAQTARFKVNKGSQSGVEVGDSVVIHDTLLGRIVDISDHTSELELIASPNSSVAVKSARADLGLLQLNQAGELEIRNILKTTQLSEDTKIFTSGVDSIYPPGLYIGEVGHIKSDDRDSTKTAIVSPALNYSGVLNVFILHTASRSNG